MNDLISRKQAIDVASGYCHPANIADELRKLPSAQPEITLESAIDYLHKIGWMQEHDRILTESAQPKPQWIPVTERLPEEERKEYWICTDTGYQCECRWTNVNHFWTDLTTSWHWHIMDVPQYAKVVAWMPLPEPYKGGQE